MKKALIPLLFSLGGLLFALGVSEVIIRVFFSKSSNQKAWSDRPSFYFGAEGRPSLQGAAYDPVKPRGVFRIAVIGDSYSFAPYMQFTDTFVSKLEAMLNLNIGERRAEVINYGIPAYSTNHEIATTEQALKEGADLVILQITLNDPELKPYRPVGLREDMVDQFGRFAPRGNLATLISYWRTLGFVLERIHNTQTHNRYRDYFFDLFRTGRTRENFRRSLKQIVGSCWRKKVTIVGVIFPLFGSPLDSRYPFFPLHQEVAEFLRSNKTRSLDLFSAFEGIPFERLQVMPGVDRHPNEIAHRIAAEEIYKFLEGRELIPKEFRIKIRSSERTGITSYLGTPPSSVPSPDQKK